jgi:hypothetical protein
MQLQKSFIFLKLSSHNREEPDNLWFLHSSTYILHILLPIVVNTQIDPVHCRSDGIIISSITNRCIKIHLSLLPVMCEQYISPRFKGFPENTFCTSCIYTYKVCNQAIWLFKSDYCIWWGVISLTHNIRTSCRVYWCGRRWYHHFFLLYNDVFFVIIICFVFVLLLCILASSLLDGFFRQRYSTFTLTYLKNIISYSNIGSHFVYCVIMT